MHSIQPRTGDNLSNYKRPVLNSKTNARLSEGNKSPELDSGLHRGSTGFSYIMWDADSAWTNPSRRIYQLFWSVLFVLIGIRCYITGGSDFSFSDHLSGWWSEQFCFVWYSLMKGIESSPGYSRRPHRHNNVVRSTVMILLGLAGWLWWNNTYTNNINPNNVDFNDAIPVSNEFSWHQVFTHPHFSTNTD